MGKPYQREIDNLDATYSWCRDLDVSEIARKLRSTWHLPLISVGSGGSHSGATLHASLHHRFFNSGAQAITPMDLVGTLPRNGQVSVWFLSASGNNIDIRRAFAHAAICEPRSVSAIVGSKKSKIKGLSEKYKFSDVFEYPFPNGRDGFLATNSLLGISVVLYRAYCEAADYPDLLPNSLHELFRSSFEGFDDLEALFEKSAEICNLDSLHVIYSPHLKSAAVDIESRFIEAGLGGVHISDLRNFAHGRHHWFSKNTKGSGILALTASSESELGSKTLALLPDSVPKLHLSLDDTHRHMPLVGILLSMHFANWRGQRRGIDPGRPGVPQYGSKIYRLTTKSGFRRSAARNFSAIERKRKYGVQATEGNNYWESAYKQFVRSISKQRFGALVLDYDGTIVDGRSRDEPPSQEICDELVRLLSAGLLVGFATGRGKSIRTALQKPHAIPKEYWQQVVIGYYNGSDISYLADDLSPNSSTECCKELKGIAEFLQNQVLVGSLEAKITLRPKQITMEPISAVSETLLWETTQDLLSRQEGWSGKVLRSSHSIDIVAPSVSKLEVVKIIEENLNPGLEVLTIGDRGRWPGNDTELLGGSCSLSVDEVSFAHDSCWNLCAAGVRGPQGALEYLRKVRVEDGIGRLKF